MGGLPYHAYDGAGRLLQVEDANGVVTTMTYTARGWVETRTVAGETVSYEYYPTGKIKKLTHPTGEYLEYTYDDAQRLIAVNDNLGNKIEYTLDTAGNRTQSAHYDPQDNLQRMMAQTFDIQGRLESMLDAYNATQTYTYDAGGNQISATDANSNTTDFEYDALDRLEKSTDALNGETLYDYDPRDNLTGVTDATGLSTLYNFNGLDDQTALDSPDTGIKTTTYDEAGNPQTVTDARGITATFSYDALNRVTLIDYPGTAEDTVYSYDQAHSFCWNDDYATGRVSTMTVDNITLQYCYDEHGNVTRQRQTIDGITFDVQNAYLEPGRLVGKSYPSGNHLDIQYDAGARVSQLQWNDIVGTPLVSNITYNAYHAPTSWEHANGIVDVAEYDLNGRLTARRGGIHVGFVYDPAGNLVELHPQTPDAPIPDGGSQTPPPDNPPPLDNGRDPGAQPGDPTDPPDDPPGDTGTGNDDGSTDPVGSNLPMQVFTYDALNRLETVETPNTVHKLWIYDAIGNRLMETRPDINITDPGDQDGPITPSVTQDQSQYTYAANSHHLIDVDGNTIGYDAVGNAIQFDGFSAFYNDRNRLAELSDSNGVVATYRFNAKGERVSKTVGGITTYFVYDLDGKLLGEYDDQGALIQEYVYLNGAPVAVRTATDVFHLHTDHLGTPRAATNAYGSQAWHWPLLNNAFGDQPAEAITSSDGPGL